MIATATHELPTAPLSPQGSVLPRAPPARANGSVQRIRDVDLIETRVEALRRDPAYHMSRWTPDQRAAAVSLYKLHQENPRFQGELKTYASLQRRLPSIEHPNYLSEGQIYSLLDALHETPDV